MASPSKGLGQKHARRDDVSFLEGRVFRATGPSQEHWDRPQTRLAGSRSEAQPPGARMAVREKTVTRRVSRVKHSDTGCGGLSSTTSFRMKGKSPASTLFGCWRLVFQILVVPGEDAVEAIEEVLFLAEAVGLARVDDHLGLDAIALQAAIKFLALAQRVREVHITLENERRCFGVPKLDERGTIEEAGDLFRFIRHAVEPFIVRGALLGAIF